MSLDEWRSKPLIFVEDLERPVLDEADLHHYQRVRRLADREPITVSDGAGRWRSARFGSVPEIDGPIELELAPTHPSTVGFTPVKGERPEWVVQKLTELGVDVILPLQTQRSVVRWDGARAAKQLAKWRVIAREASMQSRRVRIPTVLPVTSLAQAIRLNENMSADAGGSVSVAPVFAEPGGQPLNPSVDRFVLVGPEGGWDADELRGQQLRSLPGGVLRAETAAIAAAVLLASSS